MLRAGVPLPEAARRLGHSVESPLRVYAGVFDDDRVRANSYLDADFSRVVFSFDKLAMWWLSGQNRRPPQEHLHSAWADSYVLLLRTRFSYSLSTILKYLLRALELPASVS